MITEVIDLNYLNLINYKPRYLNKPALQQVFEIEIDTGSVILDKTLQKLVKDKGAKFFTDKLTERFKLFDGALKGLDDDIDKKCANFLKDNKIDKDNISKDEQKLIDEFLKYLSDLTDDLQKYLQQIIDGINKSESVSWVNEILEKCYKDKSFKKLAKKGRKYSFTRSSRGVAKIIIITSVSIAAAAIFAATLGAGVAASVLTAGIASPFAIVAIIGGGLVAAGMVVGAVTGCKKIGINIYQEVKKLNKSAVKLQSDLEKVAVLISKCKEIYDFCAEDAKNLSEYSKAFGGKGYKKFKRKPTKKQLLLVLKGTKSIFKNFETHLDDVKLFSISIATDIMKLKKEAAVIDVKMQELIRSIGRAENVSSQIDAKKIKSKKELRLLKEIKSEMKKTEKQLEKLRDSNTELHKNINDANTTMRLFNNLIEECESIKVSEDVDFDLIKDTATRNIFRLKSVGKLVDTVGKLDSGLKTMGNASLSVNSSVGKFA